VAVGGIGYVRQREGAALTPNDDDTPEDRHRFLGLATLLLAGLSVVAVVFTAIASFFFESCR
jgi:hypothetical protein